ncbi:MAG: cytochrome c biogenesis protein CcsA [Planctomycetia bacterium]|nr:cytochrome c biogenesis protein CcsA [Planctomycetia bacterium]
MMKNGFKNSIFLLPVRVIGSMFFAIALILILAAVMAWATFLGMQFGDDSSSWAVYHAGWFMTLCGLLGLSVLFSALLRFPWKKYQIGFLVTHLGILVLLFGCLLDFRYGQSAFLSVGEGETNRVAICPGDVHFELEITDSAKKTEGDSPKKEDSAPKSFRKSIPFTPGPFSWRFYGDDALFGWGVSDYLPRFPWSFLTGSRTEHLLYDVDGCRLEVLDYLQSGTGAEAGKTGNEAGKTGVDTEKSGVPVGVSDFRWEVIKAGGNPGPLKDGETKMSVKQRLASWTSWVKVRLTLDGEAEEFWLRQFDYFMLDGMTVNKPTVENQTVFQFTTKTGKNVKLVYAQNTVKLYFGIQLDRFNNRLDPGTSTASHYSSDVRIVMGKMEEKGTETVTEMLNVSMNQPLDISEPVTGQVWRLFQTSFSGPFLNEMELESTRDQFYVSTFTVRHSPGRGLLYLGCLLIVLGIGIMFSMKAYFFGTSAQILTATVLVLSIFGVGNTSCAWAGLVPGVEDRKDFDFSAWAEMPICRDGRIMPLDAFARTHVRMICGKESPRILLPAPGNFSGNSAEKRKFQAAELLFAWIAEPEVWEMIPFIRLDDVKLREWMELPTVGENGKLLTTISPAELSYMYNSLEFNQRYALLEEKIASASENENSVKEKQELVALREKLLQLESRYVTWLQLVVGPVKKMRSGTVFDSWSSVFCDAAHVPYMGQVVSVSYLQQNLVYLFCNSYEPRLSLYGAAREKISSEELAEIQKTLKIPERPERKFSPAELYVSLRENPKLWKHVPFLFLKNVEVRKILKLPVAETGEMPFLYVAPMELVTAMQENTEAFRKAFPTLPEEVRGEMNRLESALQLYCYWIDGQFLENIPLGQRFYQDYENLRQVWFGTTHPMMGSGGQALDVQFLTIVLQRDPVLFQKMASGWRTVSPKMSLNDAIYAGTLTAEQWDFLISCMTADSPELALFSALRKVSGAFSAVDTELRKPLEKENSGDNGTETDSARLLVASRKLAELRTAADCVLPALEDYCRSAREKLPKNPAESDREWFSYLKICRISMRNFAACLASVQYEIFDEDQAIYVLPSLESEPINRNRTEKVQVFSQYMELEPQPWVSLNYLRFGTGTEKGTEIKAETGTGTEAGTGTENETGIKTETGAEACASAFQEMVYAWHENLPEKFRTASVKFREILRQEAQKMAEMRAKLLPEAELDADALAATEYPVSDAPLKREVFYNRFRPFTWAWVFPFVATLILGASVFFRFLEYRAEKEMEKDAEGEKTVSEGKLASEGEKSASVNEKTVEERENIICVFHRFGAVAFWMGLFFLILGLLASTVGLVLRSWIMGRAPVTNMFETIVFVAWSAGVLGIVLTFRVQFARIISLGWNAARFKNPGSSSEMENNPKMCSTAFRATLWLGRVVLAGVFFWLLGFYGLGNGNGYTAVHLTPVYAIGASVPSLSAWVEWFTGIVMLGAFLWWVPLFLIAPVAGSVLYFGKSGTVSENVADSTFNTRLERQRFQSPFFACATALVVFVVSYISVSFPDIFKPDLRNLMPVLRDNYWLAVHVVTIVASYGAGMLAWGLANGALCCYLFGRYRTVNGKRRPPEICSTLSELLYRCMQAAVLLLVVGTILGGLWADVSWGKFWSWDRKEVWALISLFVYLLILHGRYVRLLGEFTLAVGAVLGAFAIIMAWYGVNYVMGSALHGYGAGSGSLIYAGFIVGVNCILIFSAIIRYVLETQRPS